MGLGSTINAKSHFPPPSGRGRLPIVDRWRILEQA